jgi:hypothetical protein
VGKYMVYRSWHCRLNDGCFCMTVEEAQRCPEFAILKDEVESFASIGGQGADTDATLSAQDMEALAAGLVHSNEQSTYPELTNEERIKMAEIDAFSKLIQDKLAALTAKAEALATPPADSAAIEALQGQVAAATANIADALTKVDAASAGVADAVAKADAASASAAAVAEAKTKLESLIDSIELKMPSDEPYAVNRVLTSLMCVVAALATILFGLIGALSAR